MIECSMTTRVEAPVVRTFDVFTDLAQASARVEGIRRIEVLTDGPVGAGTRFRETRVMFGREATEEMEITEFDPGRSYAVECDSCGAHYRSVFEFREAGAGTDVKMTMSVGARSVMAKLMSPLARLGMAAMKKAMARDLAQLKAFAEGGDAGGA